MRLTGGMLAAGAMLAGCVALRMEGFDEIAGRGERIDVRHIPAWQSGGFAVGNDGTRGHVRRVAIGEVITDDPQFQPFPAWESSLVARYGRYAFRVEGAAVGGTLSAACSYGREEAVRRAGSVSVAAPYVPLSLFCSFSDGMRPIGTLELGATLPGDGVVSVTGRAGQVEVAGARLLIRSAHRGEQVGGPIDRRVGYTFASMGGRAVGAAELASSANARLALPREGAERRAALAAGLALALFWDPGDTD